MARRPDIPAGPETKVVLVISAEGPVKIGCQVILKHVLGIANSKGEPPTLADFIEAFVASCEELDPKGPRVA